MQYLFLFLKSIAVGGANVMPGVSGATLAVIFRMYDRLIESINNLFSDMKESLKFLIPVGLGMVVGILAVGEAIDFFLVRFSLQAGGFIAGLMAGGVPFIYNQARLRMRPPETSMTALLRNSYISPSEAKIKPHYYAISVIAFVIIVLLTVFLSPDSAAVEGEAVTFSIGFSVYLFIAGTVAAAAMVVPGVSGAMVFMLFGVFPMVMHTIALVRRYITSPTDFELLGEILVVAAPLGLGIVAGVLLGSKLVAFLLDRFHSATYFAILGLIFGTVFAIFHDPATYASHDSITPMLIFFTLITYLCGMATSILLGNRKKEE